MKNHLVLIFILIGTMAQSQSITDTIYWPNGSIERAGNYNSIDSSWTLFHYYQNGDLMTIEYLDGDNYFPIGQRTCFNPNNNLAYIISFNDGHLMGPFIEFYSNGNIETTGYFYNGFKTGKWTHYNEHGKILSEITYVMTKSDSIYGDTRDNGRLTELELNYGLMPVSYRTGKNISSDTLPVREVYKVLEPEIKK